MRSSTRSQQTLGRSWGFAILTLAVACTGPSTGSSDDGSRPRAVGDGSSTLSPGGEPAPAIAERRPTTNRPATTEHSAATESRATLDSGLDVELTAVPGSGTIAVVLVYDIGSHHDPAGQSGLAHFVEHLLATAATSAEDARTVDTFIASYPLGWNAQTGTDFTVIATVVEPSALERELTLTAARLAGIHPIEDDVSRERDRILLEVDNMFGGIPQLAVANHAREQLQPTPNGGRRGGRPDVLASVTLQDVIGRVDLYNPSNATLSIAGELDVDTTLALVTEHFADIPPGPTAPPPAESPVLTAGLVVAPVATRSGVVAVAYAAPAPTYASYPAFLIAISRLFAAGPTTDLTTSYAPIDDPGGVVITSPFRSGEDGATAHARVRSTVNDLLTSPLADGEAAQTSLIFGSLLGWTTSYNTYGVALSAARRPHMAIDPQEIADALLDVDGPSFLEVTDRLFIAAPTAGAASDT